MASPSPHDWTFRPATFGEAEEACAVIRSSIIELCGADQDGDPAIPSRWLANKTPDQPARWIEANPDGVLAGVGGAGIGGVGMVMPDGNRPELCRALGAVQRRQQGPDGRDGALRGQLGTRFMPPDQHYHGARVPPGLWLSG